MRPIPKTYLFVPANRPERIAKAFAASADEVIVDWEDAVPDSEKAEARAATAEYCRTPEAPTVWLRINGAASPHHAADVSAAVALSEIKGIFLAKTETAADIEAVFRAIGKPVIAVIENVPGWGNVADIARAHGIAAFTYGCLDLANSLGVRYGTAAAQTVFDRLRTDLLLHSCLNQLAAPIETIYPDFNDTSGLQNAARYWHDMGFGGALCIHPKQVAAIKEALRPSENELAFAAKVLAEAARSGAAVFQVDGQMVDAPVIAWARHVLAAS